MCTIFSEDAVIENQQMALSAIRIPIQYYQPKARPAYRKYHFTIQQRLNRKVPWFKFVLSLGMLSQNSNIYAIPGSNHAVINDHSSKNLNQQKICWHNNQQHFYHMTRWNLILQFLYQKMTKVMRWNNNLAAL